MDPEASKMTAVDQDQANLRARRDLRDFLTRETEFSKIVFDARRKASPTSRVLLLAALDQRMRSSREGAEHCVVPIVDGDGARGQLRLVFHRRDVEAASALSADPTLGSIKASISALRVLWGFRSAIVDADRQMRGFDAVSFSGGAVGVALLDRDAFLTVVRDTPEPENLLRSLNVVVGASRDFLGFHREEARTDIRMLAKTMLSSPSGLATVFVLRDDLELSRRLSADREPGRPWEGSEAGGLAFMLQFGAAARGSQQAKVESGAFVRIDLEAANRLIDEHPAPGRLLAVIKEVVAATKRARDREADRPEKALTLGAEQIADRGLQIQIGRVRETAARGLGWAL